MSNLKNRVKKVEAVRGMSRVNKYLCITGSMVNTSAEEKAKGYKVQPAIASMGGTGEEPFYIATLEELDAFAARPDVELTIVNISYTDTPIKQEYK